MWSARLTHDALRASARRVKPARLSSVLAVAAALLVMVVNMAPAGAATATDRSGSRVSFGIEPASAGTSAARSNFSLAVTPGALVNDNVAVLNFSSAPLSLQLYPTDAVETTDAGFGLLPATTTPTGVGSWITLPPGSATLQVPAQSAAGPGQVIVPMTVHIPVQATPGDHVGGVVASLQTTGTNASGQKVILDQRVGTRVFVRVSGTLAPKLTVTNLHASYDGTLNPVGKGAVQVSYLVSNTGNTDLAVDQTVGTSGLVADSRSVKLPKIALLLPGSSVTEHVTVPGLWPQFLLHTTVTAQPLTASGAPLPGLVTVTASTWVWAIPWSAIVILLVLLGGLWWYLRRRRRQRAAAQSATPTPVPQSVGVGS
jgi:hypothetical protein